MDRHPWNASDRVPSLPSRATNTWGPVPREANPVLFEHVGTVSPPGRTRDPVASHLMHVLVILLSIGLVAWLGLSGLLYVIQDRLLFYPQPLNESRASQISKAFPLAEVILIRTQDQVTLHGWFLKAAGRVRAPVLFYFGGNAEEVSGMLGEAQRFPGWSLVLVNYRGYGLSEGKPSEQALLSDALLIYDTVAQRPDVDPGRVGVLGRSLGSGVAVHLAAHRTLVLAVLVSPFDSAASLARRSFALLPVSLLLKHRFDSLALAPSIKTPLLVIVAEADSIIPPVHARRLLEAWGGPKTWQSIGGVDHNGIDAREEYWQGIARILGQVALVVEERAPSH
jgi:dienelactone hydrolase